MELTPELQAEIERKALKRYPIRMRSNAPGCVGAVWEIDTNEPQRLAYISGYTQCLTDNAADRERLVEAMSLLQQAYMALNDKTDRALSDEIHEFITPS